MKALLPSRRFQSSQQIHMQETPGYPRSPRVRSSCPRMPRYGHSRDPLSSSRSSPGMTPEPFL